MRKAFTLIELLIVIGIITILVTMGAVSYGTAQKKSRDAKRKGDLKVIQNAFEQYYAINSFQYPVPPSNTLSGSLTSGSVTIITYPKDPTGGASGYYQCSSCTATSFSICANLEIDTPSNFCVQNQQ